MGVFSSEIGKRLKSSYNTVIYRWYKRQKRKRKPKKKSLRRLKYQSKGKESQLLLERKKARLLLPLSGQNFGERLMTSSKALEVILKTYFFRPPGQVLIPYSLKFEFL
jgi:hypothetical protein